MGRGACAIVGSRETSPFELSTGLLATVVTNLGNGQVLMENVTMGRSSASCFKVRCKDSPEMEYFTNRNQLGVRSRIVPGATLAASQFPWVNYFRCGLEDIKRVAELELSDDDVVSAGRLQRARELFLFNKMSVEEVRVRLARVQEEADSLAASLTKEGVSIRKCLKDLQSLVKDPLKAEKECIDGFGTDFCILSYLYKESEPREKAVHQFLTAHLDASLLYRDLKVEINQIIQTQKAQDIKPLTPEECVDLICNNQKSGGLA